MRLHGSSASVVEVLERRVLLSTYMVTNHLDSGPGSLRGDIQMSNASPGPNTITFAVSGTITLTTGELNITQDVTITGPGAASLTISGGNNSRIFDIAAGVTASVSGLTITAGNGLTAPDLNPPVGGGAVHNSGDLSLFECVISGNTDLHGEGGGIYNAGNLAIDHCVISANNGRDTGGAIYTNSGQLTISDSTIDSNSNAVAIPGNIGDFGGDGGGIYAASGRVVIDRSTISNNRAGNSSHLPAVPAGAGGGIYNARADLWLVNDTLTGNASGHGDSGVAPTAGGNGGGIYSAGDLHLINVTLVGNGTGFGGGNVQTGFVLPAGAGGGIFTTGHAFLANSVVARNVAGYPPPVGAKSPDDLDGAIDPASSYNLIGAGDAATGLSGATHNQIGTDMKPIDPELSALGDYGGPTKTMPPMPGSPTIDAGSNALALGPDGTPLATDQRGQPRIRGAAVDLGSVETPPAPNPLVVTNTSDQFDVNYGPDNLSLREALAFAHLSDGPAIISFAKGVAGTIMLDPTLGALDVTNAAGVITVDGPGAATLSVSAATGRTFTVDSTARAAIDGLRIISDDLADKGGAVLNSGELTLANDVVGGNTTGSTGGLYNDKDATLNITDTTISYNGATTGTGGGILNVGTAALTDCVIANNQATTGGGIENDGALTLVDCTVADNTATRGAGIYNNAAGVLLITGSTLANNVASVGASNGLLASGGGIDNLGNATLINSTISGNRAEGGGTNSDAIGGGVDNAGTIALTNCTVADNFATAGEDPSNDAAGGGIYVMQGTMTLNNTIVSNNYAAGPGPGAVLRSDLVGSVNSSSAYNLIGDGSQATGLLASNHNQIGTSANPIDPRLGPLANNGGPTQSVALLAGSPAIDAGSNALAVGPDGKPLLTDQRGFYRIFNGTVDIGAYEFGSSALLPGDANGDGRVDFADLVLVARHWGMTNTTWPDGDFNNDGSVGFDDLLIVARNFGKSVSLTGSAAGVFSASVVDSASSGSPLPATSDVSQSHRHQRRLMRH